ncbi:hypothetical protein A3K64_02875 [Candidatus Micrarchaeota archaeon RBG_16_36_9]|nr:MAG: hypothetical protein A3K64_02875 [Candidatus Micrarchaeota archaeon RBG_16_36_9]
MIKASEMQQKVSHYTEPYIGSLGSHSALDISRGAFDEGFKTIVVCKRGREKPYQHHIFRKRGMKDVGCINKIIILEEWKDIVKKESLEDLSFYNTIFIPNRSFEVYVGHNLIEDYFTVPMLGNRGLLRIEERTGPYKIEKNQDYLIKLAGIPAPKRFEKPVDIDREVIIKATKAIGERYFQRAGDKSSGLPFPKVSSEKEYEIACERLKQEGKTETEKEMIERNFRAATIEEYVPGECINLNFFQSAMNSNDPPYEGLELSGCDVRKQFPNGEELLHQGASLRESLLGKAYDIGKKFVDITKQEYPPGIIGPFALQTVADKNEDLLTFDVSPRIPGSPDTEFTPYTGYLYGKPTSFGRRIAQEIKEAIISRRLEEIVS